MLAGLPKINSAETAALSTKGIALPRTPRSAIWSAVHYFLTVRQFLRSLKILDTLLEKATKHAEARKFDVNNFCSSRLAPDMLPFLAQVRIACDTAKATASNLSGKEAPKHEDNETTVPQLRERIGKCLAYLDTFTPADFERSAQIKVQLPRSPGKYLKPDEYLFGRQIPNFYFHVVTAYDILRHGGVEIGKSDYLGSLDFIEL